MPPLLQPRDPRVRKLLVVDLGVLGDTVHLLPALWELRAQFPAAALHVATSPAGAGVLALAGVADRVWPLEQDAQKRTAAAQWDAIRHWRRERLDLAVTFSGADRAVLTTAASGARIRVGHAAGRRHFWNRWLIAHWIPRQPRHLPVFEQRRQVLAAAGLDLGPVRFGIQTPAADSAWAAATIPAGGVHLSISASHPQKEWPLQHWAGLARTLASSFPAVVATAGPGTREQERLNALAGAVPEPGLAAVRDTNSLGRLAAVLQRCAGHIGGDSGVTHLAMALGRPTVTLFRDYDGRLEWTPPGAGHRQLFRPCECLRGPGPACLAAGHARCLAEIPPEAVAAEALSLFRANPQAGGA